MKKRSKKLFLLRSHHLTRNGVTLRVTQGAKVFWFFFARKNILLFLLAASCTDKNHIRVGDIIPSSPAEHLQAALPAHWVVAHTVKTLQVDAIEMVPDGQSRARWTDMLTVVWIDRAVYHNLTDQSAALAQTFEKRCASQAAVTTPEWIDEGPYHATLQTLRCARSPEGFGHVMVVKTIKGHDAYYQVQRAWRLPAGDVNAPDAAMAAATRQLASVRVCAVNPGTPACG